jgi:hypothetical protein
MGSSSVSARIEVVLGHAKVVARAEQLEDLALRCEQPGAMHALEHFLSVPTYRAKVPHLVLGWNADGTLHWAALLYEIVLLEKVPTGIFSTDDISGFRTVIAPAEERALAVRLVAETLLEQRAQIVVLSFAASGMQSDALKLNPKCPARWAICERPVEGALLAHGSYEAMLMSLGKSTRFNMRYYRRRLERDLRTEFVSDARGMFSEDEIESLNALSLNPFRPGLARLQYRSACSMRGGFLVGLRTEEGRWLGLVGGWRQAGTTVLLWQFNRAGMESRSLGVVMRGHFLEHEIANGAQRVLFYGGSPNSIQHAFVRETVTDLVVVRQSRMASLLWWLTSIFAKPQWFLKSKSYLAATLHDPALAWRETGAQGKTDKIEGA